MFITGRTSKLSPAVQGYKQYLAGRSQPLYKQLEENFKSKERIHERAKVQQYNESVRPPKLRTVSQHRILMTLRDHATVRSRTSVALLLMRSVCSAAFI